jgi:hypothetical protein
MMGALEVRSRSSSNTRVIVWPSWLLAEMLISPQSEWLIEVNER